MGCGGERRSRGSLLSSCEELKKADSYLHHIGQTMFDGGRNCMGSRRDVQLREDAFDVESYGSFSHAYDFGDFPVCLAVFDPI